MPQTKDSIQYGKLLLTVDNVSAKIGSRYLFRDASFIVRSGESVALTGSSGCGKSSLLRLISGEYLPDSGTISVPSSVKVGYLPQYIDGQFADDNITVKDMYYQSRGLDELEKEKTKIEHDMAEQEFSEELFDRYAEVTEKYEAANGYTAENEAERILAGLGIMDDKERNIHLDTKLSEVSSGQRTRLLLGKVLFSQPDLLILDDPTSHLDVSSVEWLGNFLKQIRRGSLVASNDIDFLNIYADKVVEITDIGRAIVFDGNYKQFMQKRDELIDAEIKLAEHQKSEIERLEETVQRYRKWGNRSEDVARRRVVTEKRVERLKEQYEQLPGAQVKKEVRVKPQRFEINRTSGQDVLSVSKVSKSYDKFKAVELKDLSFVIRKGERFLVTGKNGSGKSTLLRMIALSGTDEFNPDRGLIEVGDSVDMGYYAPDRSTISEDNDLMQEAKRAMDFINEGRIRAVMTYWGFDGRELESRFTKLLSKGERTQLELAKLMLSKPNLLVLDEPSNNLSPQIKQRLVDALEGYKGTLLLVSHDLEFLRDLKIARELVLPSGKINIKRYEY